MGRHAAPKRSKRVTETPDYVAMIGRLIGDHHPARGDRGLLKRWAEDPSDLALYYALREQLDNAFNMAIARAQSGEGGVYSFGEIAGILDMSRPSAYERAKKGRALLDEKRESFGVVALRKLRSARLAAAGVTDRRVDNDRRTA